MKIHPLQPIFPYNDSLTNVNFCIELVYGQPNAPKPSLEAGFPLNPDPLYSDLSVRRTLGFIFVA